MISQKINNVDELKKISNKIDFKDFTDRINLKKVADKIELKNDETSQPSYKNDYEYYINKGWSHVAPFSRLYLVKL